MAELQEMSETFPYSQAIHILLAKASSSASSPYFEKKLNHAAVYTSDRKNLKKFIENTTPSPDSGPIDAEEVEEVEESGAEATAPVDAGIKPELEDYLEKLRVEKEALARQSEEGISEDLKREKLIFEQELDIKIAEAEAKLNSTTTSEGKEEQASETSSVMDAKEKESFFSELNENLKSLQSHKENIIKAEAEKVPYKEDASSEEPVSTRSNNIEKERMEEYLSNLKASEKTVIEDERLREQIDLINSFIEKAPALSKLEREVDEKENRVDLSLKSLKVSESIASENLALIMAKQGKIEKAEEIYNKLIWKFPEKRAYFVARIEDLKKK